MVVLLHELDLGLVFYGVLAEHHIFQTTFIFSHIPPSKGVLPFLYFILDTVDIIAVKGRNAVNKVV